MWVIYECEDYAMFCFWIVYKIYGGLILFFLIFMIFRNWTRMSKEASNGDHNSAAKAPPTPSPLRFSKFFQV
jgi:hypothetical protein